MGKIKTIFSILCIAAACFSLSAEPKDFSAQERELKVVIKKMVSYLEDRKCREVIEEFLAPDELKKFKENQAEYEKAMDGFIETRADKLRGCLDQALNYVPEFNADGTEADFFQLNCYSAVRFKKIDGKWYFRD
jgi:hypothetical protein